MIFPSGTKTAIFYVLASIAFVSILSISYYNTRRVKTSSDLVEHTQDVIRMNDDVLVDVLNIETSFRGYILSGDKNFLGPFYLSSQSIDQNVASLKLLTKDSKVQQLKLQILETNVSNRLAFTIKYIDIRASEQLTDSQKTHIITSGKTLTDKIRSTIISINKEEINLLAQRKLANDHSNNYADKLYFLILVFSLSLLTIGALLIRSYRKRTTLLEVSSSTQKLYSEYTLSLIEASLDPLVTINTEGKITDMNEAMVNITGKARSLLTGTDFLDYFTEPQMAREVYQEVFARGSVTDSPLTLRHTDGKLTDVLFNGSVYKDDKGNVIGVVVVARDITERKRIEKDLMEAIVFAELATSIAEEAKIKAENATRTAEDAVKSKQQFLSNMSHEIRTPMNAIIGFTKVVLKTELTIKQKEYLQAIKMSGDALIVLINDILDLAKVDAGKMTFEQTPFRMAMSISAMLHLFETKIQEKNLMLVKEYDDSIPDVLVGDPVRLHQIILNLVSNAVKFTSRGQITVNVQLISQDEESAKIQFSVIDTGIGIPEAKIKNIFENFQQASSTTSRLYGGTGLGLAIVKQLVEPQGGSISVKSKINEGSTFSFILNFQKTSLQAESETDYIELDNAVKNIKVLVVEDIALNQLLMKTLLDDFGFEREIAANGKIAIKKLQEGPYDIVLMDLQMPEMNGFEATEYIRNTMKSDIPIIALTADVTTVDLAKCKAVGMNDYIAKPVNERILYSKIIGLVKKPLIVNERAIEKIVIEKIVKSSCIDLDYLIHRTKSNPQLMMEMISLYLEQTPRLINTMNLSFHDKNWNLLHATVHKMIPSFSIMGISVDFENMAKKVQEYAGTQQQSASIQEMVLQIGNVCAQACTELETEYNRIKKSY